MKFPEIPPNPGVNGEIAVVLHHVDGFTRRVSHIDDHKKLLDSGEFFMTNKEAAYRATEKKDKPKKKVKKD